MIQKKSRPLNVQTRRSVADISQTNHSSYLLLSVIFVAQIINFIYIDNQIHIIFFFIRKRKKKNVIEKKKSCVR